jgi:putative endonuclease
MFYVYVLKSKVDDKLYIGFTSDLKRRFWEHNNDGSPSTKDRAPFDLIYYEAYRSKSDATLREKKLKGFKNSYTELKKRIAFSLNVHQT